MERFFSKIEVSRNTKCWSWTDHLEYGYGVFSVRGTIFRAHRFAYLIFNGQIPKNLIIDHLCRNRKCVNPDHLEAVTNKINLERGIPSYTTRNKRTHCKKGHPISGRNALARSDGGSTRCRLCTRNRYKMQYRIKKELHEPRVRI